MNTIKTVGLMTLLIVLFMWVGDLIGGRSGMIIAFSLAVGMNFISYWFSDRIVLAMYGAKPVSYSEAPELYSIVSRLAQKAQLPMPKVYIIPLAAPNAFATGRNPEHAAVAVTTGILNTLSREELEGVLAHELSHVKHRDILIGTIVATIAGAITMLASMARWAAIFGGFRGDDDDGGGMLGFIVMAILAPIAAMLIQLAISRSREYAADEGAAKLTGNPLWLANALRKLEHGVQRVPMDAQPATAHMFIVNPLRGNGLMQLFSTHPPTQERIKRLEELQYRV